MRHEGIRGSVWILAKLVDFLNSGSFLLKMLTVVLLQNLINIVGGRSFLSFLSDLLVNLHYNFFSRDFHDCQS